MWITVRPTTSRLIVIDTRVTSDFSLPFIVISFLIFIQSANYQIFFKDFNFLLKNTHIFIYFKGNVLIIDANVDFIRCEKLIKANRKFFKI